MACDHPSFVQIVQLVDELWHFEHFSIWRPSAILNWNFVILDHPRSRLCCSVVLWKFGVDPIFAVGDIAILWFCQFGWKMPNHASFLEIFEGLDPLKLWVAINTTKTHLWVKTRHLSHKQLNPSKGSSCAWGSSRLPSNRIDGGHDHHHHHILYFKKLAERSWKQC